MTRKTLLNDNRKSGGRSFDDNYSSNEESVRKTSSWTETNEKISNKYSESKFNDDLEGIHHEESISCESSTPPADEAMKVNILYRGMVYRIKGIKVICSVVAGIIILLAAMLLLGLWIVVGSKENGEINWPWSPEAHDMELPLNKTIEDTTVIFPFMKTVQLASIDGHTQSNVEKLEKNSKNPVLNTSEEVEEALGHFKAVHPPPKSNEHEAAKATPSDDLYVEYDYYYVIDPAVEYSVKHETLVKAPPGFTEESKVHPEPAVSQEERSKIIIAKRPELLSNDSLKSSEEGLVIEKIPPRSSPIFDNHESSNGEIKSESVVSNEFDDIDDDNEPLKRFEFKPSFEIRPASEKIESDLSRSRPVEDISIIDRSPHDHSASLKEYTEYGSFYSDDDTTITKTSLDDIAKDESNLNFESDATVGRIQEYRKPTNPVEAFFFEAQPDSQDEPDPHREVFKSRYDASQVILDDNDGRDPGYTRYFGDESHSDVFARRFGQSRSNEQQRRQIFGSELLPASSDVRVSVPGTVHPIPYVRRSHISAGVRPRIAHDDPHSFSARRGHGPLFQSRESQIHNLPHPLSVQNSRIPSNQEGIPKPTAFHILSGPVQRRYGPNTESSQSKSNGIVGTLRRMYEVASSLVPFSKSSRSGEEENTGEFLRDFVKESSAYGTVSRNMRAILAQSLDRYDDILFKRKRRPLSAFELYSLTYTFLDIWSFLFEKVGTLSGKDLSALSRRVAIMRDSGLTNATTPDYVTGEPSLDYGELDATISALEVSADSVQETKEVPDSQSHSERFENSAFPALKTLLNFGSAYMQYDYALDCLMLLYCKDLDSNSRENGWGVLTSNLKSVGLKVLTDKEGRETDTVSSVWRALTDWEPLECDAMFPKCDGTKALEIVNEVANASRK